jgi:hypothetical protein
MPLRNVSAKRTDVPMVHAHQWIDRERPGAAASKDELRTYWNGGGRLPHWRSELSNCFVD